jgi:DNA-binding MarR family transcriptional regulator
LPSDSLCAEALEIRILAAIAVRIAKRGLEMRLEAHAAGIGALPYGILRQLHERDFTISDLSRRMNLKPATLVPAVDALEREGLARRGQDPQDRRRTPLLLTERGHEVLSRVAPVDIADPYAQGLAALGEAQCHQLLLLLRDLVAHLPEGEAIISEVEARVRAQLPPDLSDTA